MTTKQKITLDKLVKAAGKHYSDGLVELYHRMPFENHGDSLARFIALELEETFDPEADAQVQVHKAIHVLDVARKELTQAIEALEELATVLRERQPAEGA